MPAITFGGLSSGIDTEAIISGLLGASRGPINKVASRKTAVESAISTVSSIGTSLSKLNDVLTQLDTEREVGSFTASTTNANAVVASATGIAQPGSFEIDVTQLAQAFKAYSEPLGVSTTAEATGQDGILQLSIGGELAEITVQGTDSADTIVANINAAGIGVAASVLDTGDDVRIQIRGLEEGSANDLEITQLGTDFGFDVGTNTRSRGQDAEFTVDGFAVTGTSNQVTGVIGGVTLALTEANTGPVTIEIKNDPDALATKIETLVSSFNELVNKVNTATGFGSLKATNSELSADSSIRSITGRLTAAMIRPVGSGRFQTLGSIGISLTNTGTLTLDRSKFDTAVAADARGVSGVLAGTDDFSGTTDGIADILGGLTETLLANDGVLEIKKDSLGSANRDLEDRFELEGKRLERLEDQLRRQFGEMDTIVGSNQAQLNFLISNSG